VSLPAVDSSATSTPVVLVVDDDPTVSEVVGTYLEHAGFRPIHASSGDGALTEFEISSPALVVLDLMLPDIDGLEVCRRLRESSQVPIIMLTALGEEVDRVMGLEVGADDYLTKPFSPRELVLRVQSVLRRTSRTPLANGSAPVQSVLIDGDLEVDVVAHTATKGNETLTLTAREFDLLSYLLLHPGRAFSREQLMNEVWGWSFGDQSTVTVHVRRLREKVEPDPASPRRLVTVWGVGYRWDPTP
jgi:DNA-binding response OmpR family regulator